MYLLSAMIEWPCKKRWCWTTLQFTTRYTHTHTSVSYTNKTIRCLPRIPFSFSGFETCLLTFPVNIFIAWLFRSIQPRKLKLFAWKAKRQNTPEEPTTGDRPQEPVPMKRDVFEKKMQSGFQLESAKSSKSKQISEALAAALPYKSARPSKVSFHSCIETEPLTIKKRKRRYLPWWVLFCAYFLVLVIVILCSFFTILYTLSFGYYKSFHWLTSFFASFVYDLFVGQPLKVIALAIFFSLIFKKADIDCPEDLKLNEGWLWQCGLLYFNQFVNQGVDLYILLPVDCFIGLQPVNQLIGGTRKTNNYSLAKRVKIIVEHLFNFSFNPLFHPLIQFFYLSIHPFIQPIQ